MTRRKQGEHLLGCLCLMGHTIHTYKSVVAAISMDGLVSAVSRISLTRQCSKRQQKSKSCLKSSNCCVSVEFSQHVTKIPVLCIQGTATGVSPQHSTQCPWSWFSRCNLPRWAPRHASGLWHQSCPKANTLVMVMGKTHLNRMSYSYSYNGYKL